LILKIKLIGRILITLLISLLLFFLILKINAYFKIKEIIIISPKKNASIFGLDDLKKGNFFILKAKKSQLENNLKSINSSIKTIEIEPIFPDKVKVIVDFYEPMAILIGVDINFYLSADSRILFKTKDAQEELTLINYYQKLPDFLYKTGDYLSFSDIKMAVELIDFFNQISFAVKKVDIKSDDMLIFNLGDKEILLTDKKDKNWQKTQLKKIIKQFKIEGKEFKKIDLRFDKPVVVF